MRTLYMWYKEDGSSWYHWDHFVGPFRLNLGHGNKELQDIIKRRFEREEKIVFGRPPA